MAKKVTHTNDEVKRYIGAVTEQYIAGQKAIGEQYFDLKKDITGLKGDMIEVKKTIQSHTELLNSHTEILNSHTETIGEILVKLEEENYPKLEHRVAHLETHKQ